MTADGGAKPMKTRIPALLSGLALGASLVLVPAGAAAAASPAPAGGPSGNGQCAPQASAANSGATVASLRAFADCEIDRRPSTLNTLANAVSGSKTLGSDAGALSGEIAAEKSGLTTLRASVEAETSAKVLRADLEKIVSDYRVYALVVPQVNLTIAADAVLASQPKFSQLGTAVANRIAAASKAGKNTTAAQADLATMNADVAAAMALVGPLPAQLVPLTPAQYNAGTAGPILSAARTAIGRARDDLKAAVAAGKAALAALK